MNNRKYWKFDNIPDLTGKNVIVTGANSGTGFEATKILASKGAHVIMASRNLERLNKAKEKILKEDERVSLDIIRLDLADLDSVKAFAETYKQKYKTLDLLLNNAGIMMTPKLFHTKDNFELQFGTNHLGHFALTGLLFDVLKKTPGSRIVNMSSTAHSFGSIDIDNLNWEPPKKYSSTGAYGQSKLANLLFTYELDRRIKSANLDIVSVASHPGWAATNLQSTGLDMKKSFRSRLMKLFMKLGNLLLAQSARMGSAPMLMAALSEDVEGGQYYGPKRFAESRGPPKLTKSNDKSYDQETAKKLWAASEHLTGVSYPI